MKAARIAIALATLGFAPTLSAQTFSLSLHEAERRVAVDERRRAWTLFTEGSLSTAVGVPMIVAGDASVRWAGVMTAAFGAVNLGLALPWLLRLPNEDRVMPGETELATRLRRARAARRTAAVFALNVGLDVLYLAAGATALWLGSRDNDPRLEGAGSAVLAQGTFLLAFDLWGWIASDHNADRFAQ